METQEKFDALVKVGGYLNDYVCLSKEEWFKLEKQKKLLKQLKEVKGCGGPYVGPHIYRTLSLCFGMHPDPDDKRWHQQNKVSWL